MSHFGKTLKGKTKLFFILGQGQDIKTSKVQIRKSKLFAKKLSSINLSFKPIARDFERFDCEEQGVRLQNSLILQEKQSIFL